MTTTQGRDLRERPRAQMLAVAWTTTPVDYDIAANDPTGANRCSLVILIGTAGSLVVTDLAGNNVTIPSSVITANNGRLDIEVTALVASGTTAQDVVVGW